MSNGAAAGAAAAAAAAAAEMLRQEEEEMTEYSENDLREGWEFKILRANTAAFKNPQVLKQACEEEAQAGWILVEKFDDQRLRFKRLVSTRDKDSYLPFDAYRTQFGISKSAFTGIVVAITVGATFLLIALIALVAYFAPR
ncbi:MAG TPA: hypothetical protein VK463_10150 [Desulfomonilaceae bacterium]|nr:hypothetical protein [Desulfomonilaceae bacterium]